LTLKRKAVHSFKTLINFYQTTLHHIPEGGTFHKPYCEGFKISYYHASSSMKKLTLGFADFHTKAVHSKEKCYELVPNIGQVKPNIMQLILITLGR
jgi:hypothetical protein